MKNRYLLTKLFAIGTLLSGVAFQTTGCNVLSGDQFVQQINVGAQTFINSLFAQWISTRIDGLLDVD